MNSKNKVFMVFAIIATLAIVGLCTYAVFNYTTPLNENDSDIAQFKEEYESLNGLEDDVRDNTHTTLKIDENAQIYYKTDEEIVEFMNNEQGIIYFGFSDCPWCRAMIETLISATVDKEINLYYVDISNSRNTYAFQNGEVTETEKGTDAYYEIIDFLDGKLPEYNVKNENDEILSTNTKRLYAPTIVTVKDGTLVDLYSPGSNDIADPYEKATDKEANDMYTKFLKMISDLENASCDINASTGC